MADKAISELVSAPDITETDLFVLEQNGTAKKLTGQVLINWLTRAADGHGGIQSISKTGSSGLVDTYRITLADTTTVDFAVTNGRAITSVTETAVSGLTRTYTIAFNDGSAQTFAVTDGRSITGVSKAGSSGLTDTYTITYNDGTTSTFAVNNGRAIQSVAQISTVDLVDTYRVSYNDGTTYEFTVTNGAKGDKGDNTYIHIKFASQEPTEASHSMGDIPDRWIGFYWGGLEEAPTDWSLYKWYEIKGSKGDPGDPATLQSSAVEYQVSDSGTIIPSGSWSTSVPVVAQGKYMWIRTTTTFNTGNPVVSYSVSRMGLDGSGSVTAVANISPDSNGNVPLTPADIGALADTGGDLTGELRMNGQPISGLNPPTEDTQAANMGYVNQQVKKARPRNLLDNSDFRNLVNQRNAGGAYTAWGGYTIDRWGVGEYATTINIGADGLIITGPGDGVNTASLYQPLPNPSQMNGKVYTVAVKVDGEIYCASGTVTLTGLWHRNAEYRSKTFFIDIASSDDNSVAVNIGAYNSSTFEWAALYEGEYTIDTLPEYQPKGYGAELAECQRYYREFTWLGGGTNFAPLRVMLPLPFPMYLENPTVSYYQTGGAGVTDVAMSNNDAVDITVTGDYATLRIYIFADL